MGGEWVAIGGRMSTHSKKITLWLSLELLKKVDEAAAANYETRSDFIRKSIALRLNSQVIVKTPNPEETWQALIDEALKQ